MAELRAFVGHSFLKTDEHVVRIFLDHFATLEKAGLGFTWDHAEEAESRTLSEKILSKIEGKNVFIGICTRKEYAVESINLIPFLARFVGKQNDLQWKTSDWIIQEIGLAVGRNMTIVLFLEEGVRKPGGLYGDIEYIPFNRERPGDCFDKLLEMLTALKPKTEQETASEAKSAEAEKEQDTVEVADLAPKDSWTNDDYDWAAFRAIARNDLEALNKIDAAYKASDFAKGSARVIWESNIEHLRLLFGRGGDLDKLKRLADENPKLPEAVYYLGLAYEEFQDFEKAAEKIYAAARVAADEKLQFNYLGQAALQYERTGQHKRAVEIIDELRGRAAKNPKLKSQLVSTLRRIAELKEDRPLQLALLEHEIAEEPNDTSKRFSLAYLHSENENGGDMALFHYQRIPIGERNSVTWNNIGVSYGEFDMPISAVRAFRRSAEGGETLAMSNLAYKYLNVGFFDEADKLCKDALSRQSYHKNVSTLLGRLKSINEEEAEKLKEILKKVKSKADFYRKLGRSAVAEMPSTIAKAWKAREGLLSASLSGSRLKLTGSYEVAATSRLAGVLAGGPLAPTTEKYNIEFVGDFCGRMLSGTVTRRREGGELTLLDGGSSNILMYVGDSDKNLFVMENYSSSQPIFYDLQAIAPEDKLQ